MPILDRLKDAGVAVRDKVKETVKETFGEHKELDDDGNVVTSAPSAPSLDLAGAYALLGSKDTATLADVREAYRAHAKAQHPLARAGGPASDAQAKLERLLQALELLEEHLVPLSGSPPGKPSTPSAPTSTRKRATARS